LAIPKHEEATQPKQLDETVQIVDYQKGNETITEGTFMILFYPRGNSSGGTLRFKSLDDKKEENIYAVTIDPITGKPNISLLEE